MAIKIIEPRNPELQKSYLCVCEVLTDTEADIKNLGRYIDDGRIKAEAEPGSIAYTANMNSIYQLSISGIWTKLFELGSDSEDDGVAATICGLAICGEAICGGA